MSSRMPALEEMSKEELIAALRVLQGHRPGEGAFLEKASLIHDLEVHQIELEMQNRQLRETEAQLHGSMQRYMELYDFAPIAYLTLDVEGRIQEANLTAATLLGTERGQLLGKPVSSFVAVSHRAQLRDDRAVVLSTLVLKLSSIASCQRHTIPLVRLERVHDYELNGNRCLDRKRRRGNSPIRIQRDGSKDARRRASCDVAVSPQYQRMRFLYRAIPTAASIFNFSNAVISGRVVIPPAAMIRNFVESRSSRK